MPIDPTEFADAVEELDAVLRRVRKQVERLAAEKPYLLRDLEHARHALADLQPRLEALRALDLPGLQALAQGVQALEDRVARMQAVGPPRRDR